MLIKLNYEQENCYFGLVRQTKYLLPVISNYSACNMFRNFNIKVPFLYHTVPALPYEKVAADILIFTGKDILVIINKISTIIVY